MKKVYFCVFWFFFSIHLISQSDLLDMTLEELMNIQVEVGSNNSNTLVNSVSTVTVIDRSMISAYNFQSVVEALQTVPGINIDRTYLKRDIPTSRGILQDHYANKVLIMINSIPTWNAVTGEGILNRIDINHVERIEVLKGPASVIYGTNAYSGAINIILKTTGDYNYNIDFEYTSTDMLKASASYLRQTDDKTIMLSGGLSDEKGCERSFTDETDSTGTLNEYNFSNHFSLDYKDGNNHFFVNGYETAESYLGVTPRFTSGAGLDHKLKGFLFAYEYDTEFTERLMAKYTFLYDYNNRDLPRTGDNQIRALIEGYRLTNKLTLGYKLNDHTHLELGGEHNIRQSDRYDNYRTSDDSVLAGNNMAGLKLWEFAFFSQLEYSVLKFKSLLGVRYTQNELFGENLSGRFTLLYSFNGFNTIKFIYGKSYRAPSLFEQNFATSSGTVFGNQNLEPETSHSFELVYVMSSDKLFLQLIGYHALYENKIYRLRTYYEPIMDTTNVYSNGDVFNSQGIELELKYLNPNLINGFINMNYILGNDGDRYNSFYNFKTVPKFYASAGLSKKIGKINSSAIINYKSSTSGPFGDVPEQYTVDVNLSYNHNIRNVNFRHALSLKNLNNSEFLVPEYARRSMNINALHYGYCRRLEYSLTIRF